MVPHTTVRRHTTTSEDLDYVPPKTRAPRCSERNRKPRAVKKKTGRKTRAKRNAPPAPGACIMAAIDALESADPAPGAPRRTDGPSDGLRLVCAAVDVTMIMDKLVEMGLSVPDDVDPKIRITETIRRLARTMHRGTMPDGSRVDETVDGSRILQCTQIVLFKYLVEFM